MCTKVIERHWHVFFLVNGVTASSMYVCVCLCVSDQLMCLPRSEDAAAPRRRPGHSGHCESSAGPGLLRGETHAGITIIDPDDLLSVLTLTSVSCVSGPAAHL